MPQPITAALPLISILRPLLRWYAIVIPLSTMRWSDNLKLRNIRPTSKRPKLSKVGKIDNKLSACITKLQKVAQTWNKVGHNCTHFNSNFTKVLVSCTCVCQSCTTLHKVPSKLFQMYHSCRSYKLDLFGLKQMYCQMWQVAHTYLSIYYSFYATWCNFDNISCRMFS